MATQPTQPTQPQPQPQPGSLSDTNVFVKYLPSALNDTGLYTLFSPYGKIVSSKVMVDNVTRASLGYGFVNFATPQEAQRAIRQLNGQRLANKVLLCKLSNSTAIDTTRSPARSSTPSNNLYIKPLPPTMTEDQLREIFMQFGEIEEVKVMIDQKTGLSRQIGFVRFSTVAEATTAINVMNNLALESNQQPLTVKFAETGEEKQQRRAAQRRRPQIHTGRVAVGAVGPLQPVSPIHPSSLSPGAQLTGMDYFMQHHHPFAANPYVAQQGLYLPADPYGTVAYAPFHQFVPVHHGSAPGSPLVTAGGSNGNAVGTPPTVALPGPLSISFASGSPRASPTSQGSGARFGGYGFQSSPGGSPGPITNSPSPIIRHPVSPAFGILTPTSPNIGLHSIPPTLTDLSEQNTNLFVFHLPIHIDNTSLYNLFSPFGHIESVKVMVDRATGASKGFGFVKYYRTQDALAAIEMMNGYQIGGKHLKVSFKSDRSASSPATRGGADDHFGTNGNTGASSSNSSSNSSGNNEADNNDELSAEVDDTGAAKHHQQQKQQQQIARN